MMANTYEPTYRMILSQIATGPVVHADETKGVVFGGGHYVWVFANLTSVAYVYAESRDAEILNDILAGFQGVLVSDFYGAYDAVPCRQQKCLIQRRRRMHLAFPLCPHDWRRLPARRDVKLANDSVLVRGALAYHPVITSSTRACFHLRFPRQGPPGTAARPDRGWQIETRSAGRSIRATSTFRTTRRQS
jgi:hypothetical protein